MARIVDRDSVKEHILSILQRSPEIIEKHFYACGQSVVSISNTEDLDVTRGIPIYPQIFYHYEGDECIHVVAIGPMPMELDKIRIGTESFTYKRVEFQIVPKEPIPFEEFTDEELLQMNPKMTTEDIIDEETLTMWKNHIVEQSDVFTRNDQFIVIDVNVLHPALNKEWSCQISIPKGAGLSMKGVEYVVMQNIQKECPNLWMFNGQELQAIKLSKWDTILIENDFYRFRDGEKFWVNHIKRGGVWKILLFGVNFDSNQCGWCFKASCKKRCGKCKTIKYCSVEHQRIAWPSHKLTCGKVKNPEPRQ